MTDTEGFLNKGLFWQDISNSYSRYSHSASFELFCGIFVFNSAYLQQLHEKFYVSNIEIEHLFNALQAIKLFMEEKGVKSTSCF